jgi:predicted amidohydrolase
MCAVLCLSTAALAGGLEPIQEIIEPKGIFPPERFGKVAVVAWNRTEPTPIEVAQEVADAFKQETRKQLETLIRQAAEKGAELIVTPEFGLVGYPDIPELPSEEDEFRSPEDIRPYVETVPGPSTEYFGRIAQELRVTLQIGLAEVDPKNGRYYNVAVALGPQGQLLAKYRKIELYQGEKHFLYPGSGISTYPSPFGKVGMIICADVYSGNPMNQYRSSGVELMALSTSWAQWNTGMQHFQSGARWVRTPLLAANQMYFPDTGVINADGRNQSHIRQTSGIAYGYLLRKGRRDTAR